MGTITVKNLSTLVDAAAVARVAMLMAGDKYNSVRNAAGKEIIKITCRGNNYRVTDKEDDHERR